MDGKHKEPAQGTRLGGIWRGAVPVAAAAAAALMIGGGMDLVHAHQRAGKKERPAKPAAKAQPTGPRYFIGVRRTGTALVVRDVRTGGDVGLPVAAPQGRRFQQIAPGGDGSYVVAASTGKQVTFQRLSLAQGGRPSELTEIPRVAVPGVSNAWSDLAVSANGDKIAYVTYRGAASRVDVVSTSTGQRKVWTAKAPGRLSNLSWAANTLSFVWSPMRKGGAKVHQVRALDTAGPSGDLKTSKILLRLPKGSEAAVLTRDGQSVVAGVTVNSQSALQAYSVETGKPTRVLWRQRLGGVISSLDPDRTGGHVLAMGSDGRLYSQGARALPADDFLDVAW